MIIHRYQSTAEMAFHAAAEVQKKIQDAISRKGEACLLLSTGASQFELLENLVKLPVEWHKVTVFHLDEYIDLPEEHKASFRLYIRTRFLEKIPAPKAVWLIDGNNDPAAEIRRLTEAIRRTPVDVGLIGIGANAHIAFNDPPADFETDEAYHVVNLDLRCKRQQVEEGWFENTDAVPKQAISATVKQILACESIISVVPHKVKAEAVRAMYMAEKPDPMVPASILKTHKDFSLYLDHESGALLPKEA